MSLYSIDTRGRLDPHLSQEWLLTNGLGGYASSTILGCNTRRYHGLLCAATLPPVGRVMALNRIGEIITLDENTDPLEFSINQFGERFHPRGDQYLRRFELGDIVRWEYQIEGVTIIKELQLLWMKNIVGVRYTITPPPSRRVKLQLLPFTGLRDFHGVRRGETGFNLIAGEREITVADDSHAMHLRIDAGRFAPQPDWWHEHTYAVETERGLDDTEDLFTPGRFIFETDIEASVILYAAMKPVESIDWDAELHRRRQAFAAAAAPPQAAPSTVRPPITRSAPSPTIQRLMRAADDFIVCRKSPDGKDGTSILAGYPWFADWGRDTMISLPGLLLTTGRFRQAKEVLGVFARYISEGMIPNRFDDYNNEPHYNTVDASLWFIHAVFEYLRLSNDSQTFESILLPAARAILNGYRKGTRFHIKMDEADGLITQGDEKTQLTWMDAKCDGIAFTPRQGKAVEINALWYNALRLLKEDDLANKVAENFRRHFWLNPFRGLCDVVDGDRRDTAIRPNQIFAVSLPHSPLTADQQSAVVEVVRRELLTPLGLRTLAAADPNYHGRYHGPPAERDAAYHNGTVWAWPIGAFLEAYLKVNHRSDESIGQARRWLQPLIDHLEQSCIGQISEIFEGDPPHRPVGCYAQAWSVAEVLRLAVELGF